MFRDKSGLARVPTNPGNRTCVHQLSEGMFCPMSCSVDMFALGSSDVLERDERSVDDVSVAIG